MKFIVDTGSFLNNGKFNILDAKKYGNLTAEQRNYSYNSMMLYEIADALFDCEVYDEKES